MNFWQDLYVRLNFMSLLFLMLIFFFGCFGQRYSVSIIKCYFMRLYHKTTNHLHYKLVLLQHPLVFLLSFNDASQSSMTFNFYNFHHDSVALNLSLTCSFFLLLSLSLFLLILILSRIGRKFCLFLTYPLWVLKSGTSFGFKFFFSHIEGF